MKIRTNNMKLDINLDLIDQDINAIINIYDSLSAICEPILYIYNHVNVPYQIHIPNTRIQHVC